MTPAPVNWSGAEVVVYWTGVVAAVALTVMVVVVVAADNTKFAQVIRVLLPKWTVMDRLPKKAPIPAVVEAKSS